MAGAGFEPAKAEPTRLQRVPFDRSGTPPGPGQSRASRVRCADARSGRLAQRLRLGHRLQLLQRAVLDLADPLARDVERAPDLLERAARGRRGSRSASRSRRARAGAARRASVRRSRAGAPRPPGRTARRWSSSLTKSTSAESSSSPTGFSSETGCWVTRRTSRTSSSGQSSSAAISSGRGSRPSRWTRRRSARRQLVQAVDHVHRDADRAALVGERTRHRLADPPRRVGRELVAAAVVELLDRADQPERALLDQVREREPAADVVLGDRDDKAQVGLDHVLLGVDVAPLDPLGERDLVVGVEQRYASDRVQVQAQRVGRARRLPARARSVDG